MSEKTTITYHYTPSQLRGLLSKFQDAIDRKQYSEKIPYDTWRKLMRITDDVQIDLANSIVKIFNPKDNNVIYSVKIYDWGFGRFFYDEVFKKEWNKDMTLNSDSSVTFACDAIRACDQLTGTSASQYIDTGVDAAKLATKLEAKTDYMSYFDSDSATDCSDYGTTTNYTIKWNGTPLSSNSCYITKDDYNGIWGDTGTAVTNISTIGDRVNTLESQVELLMNEKKKENDNMKGFNFEFGPCTNDNVRMSMYGLAVKNVGGTYVSYNSKSGEIMDVDILNFDGAKYLYKMPVALGQIAVGDVVLHNRKPCFVLDANLPGKTLTVVDVYAGEKKVIMMPVSPFGFNFATKVVSLFDMTGSAAASADQPFGNMLPFMLMNGDSKDMDPMMLMMLMGQSGNMNFATNPMMMYFMMKDNKNFDPMMLFAMSGAFNQPAKTAKSDNCGMCGEHKCNH